MSEEANKIAVVGAVALVTSSVAAINEFTKLFDFAPFWTDVFVAFGAMAAALFLLREALRKRNDVIIRSDDQQVQQFMIAVAPFAAPMFCAAIGIFSLWRPVSNLLVGPWYACGTVRVAQCSQPKCIKLYDERDRQTSRQCFPLDDANYFQTRLQGRSDYYPQKISIRCGKDESLSVQFSPAMVNNPRCDENMRLQ